MFDPFHQLRHRHRTCVEVPLHQITSGLGQTRQDLGAFPSFADHLESQVSSLPYLATSCGHELSPAEAQLDMLGVARNTEITTAFGLAPLLPQGTRRIALVYERLAWLLSDQTSLRLLELPMPLQPVNQLVLWTTRAENDQGLQWLRNRIISFAEEHDASQDEPVPA